MTPANQQFNLPIDDTNHNRSPIPNISAEELGSHIVYMRKELSEIKVALLGNAYNPNGFVQRLTAVEAKTDKHDRKLLVWGGIVYAAGAALVFLKDILLPPKS